MRFCISLFKFLFFCSIMRLRTSYYIPWVYTTYRPWSWEENWWFMIWNVSEFVFPTRLSRITTEWYNKSHFYRKYVLIRSHRFDSSHNLLLSIEIYHCFEVRHGHTFHLMANTSKLTRHCCLMRRFTSSTLHFLSEKTFWPTNCRVVTVAINYRNKSNRNDR